MEDRYIEDSVRQRLILAGLGELLNHGANDFSLRRVAIAAQVSCAAPYRHFKDKDELIRAIIAHIREDWTLLSGEIFSIFTLGTRECLSELLVAGVRFWVAGGNFPSFLGAGEISSFEEPIRAALEAYALSASVAADALLYPLLSAYYGAITLVSSRALPIDEAVALLRSQIAAFLSKES